MAAMTSKEIKQCSQYFTQTAYKKMGATASVNSDDIEAAVVAMVDFFTSPAVTNTMNEQLPANFKKQAGAIEKAAVVNAATSYLITLTSG